MTETKEPNWVSYTALDWAHQWEVEIDLNSRGCKMRHRERVQTGEDIPPWIDGTPPRSSGKARGFGLE